MNKSNGNIMNNDLNNLMTSDSSENNTIIKYKYESDQYCESHQKKRDIVCLTEQNRICSHCALFGGHNGHIIKTIDECIKEQQSLITEH